MCVGCTTDPAVELYFEAYLQSLTSLVHTTVTRMVYTFRTAIVKQSCNEGLASLAAASIQSVKHFINRVRCSISLCLPNWTALPIFNNCGPSERSASVVEIRRFFNSILSWVLLVFHLGWEKLLLHVGTIGLHCSPLAIDIKISVDIEPEIKCQCISESKFSCTVISAWLLSVRKDSRDTDIHHCRCMFCLRILF